MTGFVLLHEDHRGELSAFLGIDGGIAGPIEQCIGVNKDLFDRDPVLPESIKLPLRTLLLRWPRFVRQVLRFLRWSPAPWLNSLSAHSVRGDDGLYQIFLVR